jgi:hypothetical protein
LAVRQAHSAQTTEQLNTVLPKQHVAQTQVALEMHIAGLTVVHLNLQRQMSFRNSLSSTVGVLANDVHILDIKEADSWKGAPSVSRTSRVYCARHRYIPSLNSPGIDEPHHQCAQWATCRVWNCR